MTCIGLVLWQIFSLFVSLINPTCPCSHGIRLFLCLCHFYHLCQEGAASIHHEGMGEVDLSAVHLELQVTELRVVHHAAQV